MHLDDQNVHVAFLRDQSNAPRVTIAFRIGEDLRSIDVGVSYCSINDCVDKKKGRSIATRRLEVVSSRAHNASHFNFSCPNLKSQSMGQVLDQVRLEVRDRIQWNSTPKIRRIGENLAPVPLPRDKDDNQEDWIPGKGE